MGPPGHGMTSYPDLFSIVLQYFADRVESDTVDTVDRQLNHNHYHNHFRAAPHTAAAVARSRPGSRLPTAVHPTARVSARHERRGTSPPKAEAKPPVSPRARPSQPHCLQRHGHPPLDARRVSLAGGVGK